MSFSECSRLLTHVEMEMNDHKDKILERLDEDCIIKFSDHTLNTFRKVGD